MSKTDPRTVLPCLVCIVPAFMCCIFVAVIALIKAVAP